MLKSLRARNIALMAGMLFLGQALTVALVAGFVILPQADRIAGILARNVRMIGATLDALPPAERDRFIERVNTSNAYAIRRAGGEIPGVDGRPSLLETAVLRKLAIELGQFDTMVWRGGGGRPLWVRLRPGARDFYWITLAPSPGWSPTGALAGSVAIGLALSLLAGLALQRRVNRPLKALADAVDAMPDTAPARLLAEDAPEEISRVARSFEAMAARLSAQDADRALMLAGISHDLKTPIAKLRLAAALGSGDDEDTAMIERQFERIDRMLGQFLDFGRGIDAEAPERLAVRSAASDAARTLGLDPGAITGGEDISVCVRPIAFERAITNLVRNALVHGRLPIAITLARDGRMARISVSDRGDGVEPALLAALDRPFVRGNAARPSDGGTGLGLAIVRRFADAHDGTLTLENRAGGGLVATLGLPLA